MLVAWLCTAAVRVLSLKILARCGFSFGWTAQVIQPVLEIDEVDRDEGPGHLVAQVRPAGVLGS